MSEKTVIYTAEEQKSLTALAQNERTFRNVYGLLQEASHKGDKASALLEAFFALENVIKQTIAQANKIKETASTRTNAQEETASKELATGDKAGTA